MVHIRTRGRLPHWEGAHAAYFVTFRLADSLPKSVLQKLRFERQDIIATAKAMNRELSNAEKARLVFLVSKRVDTYLDSGSGECILARPSIARMLVNTLLHFNGLRYKLYTWCVMPNHVHAIFRPLEKHKLADIVHSWKSFSSKEANRLLNRSGTLWQREYYDHLLRDAEDFCGCIRYVINNPSKAGLKNWPWVDVSESS